MKFINQKELNKEVKELDKYLSSKNLTRCEAELLLKEMLGMLHIDEAKRFAFAQIPKIANLLAQEKNNKEVKYIG